MKTQGFWVWALMWLAKLWVWIRSRGARRIITWLFLKIVVWLIKKVWK